MARSDGPDSGEFREWQRAHAAAKSRSPCSGSPRNAAMRGSADRHADHVAAVSPGKYNEVHLRTGLSAPVETAQ